MVHLNDPTHAWTLGVCTYGIHRLCSRLGIECDILIDYSILHLPYLTYEPNNKLEPV